ncbi:BCD family chlorophyll transporter-like MFS transporter [Rhodothalassium salexigens DSM 2132]|uniref:BCD family chlorophyll transporter-like MFS transporter n=1 Tax=Rhodothalassium salexigens DSM 2132 TaxID=1188247 RepID=A0A4R2PM88_RHOSA|nr:BCD family MFS transporter [Rhodothalassium salexigens]MBB4211390.1 BCD family chlorophyll transporter-like MFS transporter [Rhodothalassium salexigens DSM 2132]MBK1637723.1 hypothetical protein [Rhodothalassium salexigens DSM 2132]TCP35311.1 BCD family chlorophyll transporter-like MFS transporter [Rhodothalassium salexigens DSM 2132]
MSPSKHLDWFGTFRLGLVQIAIGGIAVLMDSTINRVMVVELGMAAILPGLLMGIYYAVQLARPRLGYGSDVGGRRTLLIVGGILVLALGATGAAAATLLMASHLKLGIAAAAVAFTMVGIGSGAAGTTLLVLAAKKAAPHRRGPTASILWIMMIFGFVLSSIIAGNLLDPFSLERLVWVVALISAGGVVLTLLGIWGVERDGLPDSAEDADSDDHKAPQQPFFEALREVWAEPVARVFTVFVFVSMLAYSAQDLILEPFAGKVFAMTVGETTKLTAQEKSGALMGMILVGLLCRGDRFGRFSSLRFWCVVGCLMSATALSGLAVGGAVGTAWPLKLNIFLLGLGNGAFAIAAVGSMMNYASEGRAAREGVRMGIWGAAQGVAMGVGKFSGAAGVDATSLASSATALPYQTVFVTEAVLFVTAAIIALRLAAVRTPSAEPEESDDPAAPAGGRTKTKTVKRSTLPAGSV